MNTTSYFRLVLLCTALLGMGGVEGCKSPQPAPKPLAIVASDPKPVTLFMVGDSTMSHKRLVPPYPERGWGQLLPLYFKPELRVDNHAANGRSTKSFIAEKRWKKVRDLIKSGDYVLIEFGHNDERKTNANLYTVPFADFQKNLHRFVRETREAEGIPILATPIARRIFHDGKPVDTHNDYAIAVQQVASQEKVPLLDLNQRSLELLAKFGPERSKQLYDWFEPGEYEKLPHGLKDDTHLNAFGASCICDLAVAEIQKTVPDLGQYLVK